MFSKLTDSTQPGEAAAWSDNEDGRAIPAALADHWRQQRHNQTPCPCKRLTGHLAGRDAVPQTTNAGAGGVGQQDGADRLGLDGPGRRLPVSGRSGISPL